MQRSVMFAFIYVLAPKDVQEFIALNRHIGGIEQAAQLGEAALPYIDAKAMTESQRLLLAAYMTVYASHSDEPEPRQRLQRLLQLIRISKKYILFVEKSFTKLDPELVAQWGSPLEMVLKPTDEMVKFLTRLVSSGLGSGEYKYRAIIRNLAPTEYEHEMDRMFLTALRKTKGVESLVRLMFKHGIERMFTVQYTGSNLRVGAEQLPHVYDMLCESCDVLAMNVIPDSYLQQGFINAATIGSEKPILVFDAGCFGLLGYSEQVFITGHELGHIKSGHCLYSMIADMISGGVIQPLIGALNVLSLGLSSALVTGIELAVLNWKRTSEFTADRAGLLCCQDIDATLRCMMKLSGMSPMYYSSMNIEAFKQQARDFRELDFSTRDKLFKIMSIMGASHPWLVMRAHELLKWYESGEYQKVLDRVTQDRTVPELEHTVQEYVGLPTPDQDESGTETSFCTECGGKLAPGSKFCPQCGTRYQ